MDKVTGSVLVVREMCDSKEGLENFGYTAYLAIETKLNTKGGCSVNYRQTEMKPSHLSGTEANQTCRVGLSSSMESADPADKEIISVQLSLVFSAGFASIVT